jgi:hypothetical protein
MAPERSPFATTSTVPPYAEQVTEEPKNAETAEESGFATWDTATTPEPEVEDTPGRSWDAPPPQDTAVPVNEDMIASLISEPEAGAAEESPEPAPVPVPAANEHPTWEQGQSAPVAARESNTSFDQLLKLARELEYGLTELAEVPAPATAPAASAAQGDTRLLATALSDLQDEDDLTSLRNAIANAQERPRDVDVMLDLVLRADAIAQVLMERDQLKGAIELSLGGQPGQSATGDNDPTAESGEPVAEIPAEVADSGDEGSAPGDPEPLSS